MKPEKQEPYIVVESHPRRAHRCRLPGPFKRWRLNMGIGTVVQCRTCSASHRLSGGTDGSPYWRVQGSGGATCD